MTVDLEIETATTEIVADKIEELVEVMERIVEVVVVTENSPANVINEVK